LLTVVCLWHGRECERQRRRGPAACGHRNELVLAVGEAALEIGLERPAPRGHEPGTIVLLRAQQKGDSTPVSWIIRRDIAGLVQRHEGGAGRVRIAGQRVDLGPTPVAALGREQLLRRCLDLLGCCGGVSQAPDAESQERAFIARSFATSGRVFDPKVRSPRSVRAVTVKWLASMGTRPEEVVQ
jgi:hypothetical protein